LRSLFKKIREREDQFFSMLHRDVGDGKILYRKTGRVEYSYALLPRPLLPADHDLAKRPGNIGLPEKSLADRHIDLP